MRAGGGRREGGGGRGFTALSRRFALLAICLASSLLPLPSSLHAQDRIRQQRSELERIRQERAELERQMRLLQTTAHDLNEEVRNLDRRADATARLVATLDRQLTSISTEVNQASNNMVRAEGELAQKRVVLRQRLVDIYKRGPLYTPQVLLAAQSFGELVARYKYLHLLTLRDRALVRRVEQLRNQVSLERDRLVVLQRGIRDNREEKQIEEGRLRALEQMQRQQLARVQQETRQTRNKIDRMRLSERELSNAIAVLERERRRAVASKAAASAPRASSTVRTVDRGALDWPVDGPLIYNFGREVQPNNTMIRWDGVGIKADAGTSVKSVASGRVGYVGQLGTFGLVVIVDHGGSDYTVYGSLGRATVEKGAAIAKGQIIGTVGTTDPELGPHLHFEVRQGGPAIDPATWLRRR
jgi:septal ring factor EnvC (AmiA/AmiB activator)